MSKVIKKTYWWSVCFSCILFLAILLSGCKSDNSIYEIAGSNSKFQYPINGSSIILVKDTQFNVSTNIKCLYSRNDGYSKEDLTLNIVSESKVMKHIQEKVENGYVGHWEIYNDNNIIEKNIKVKLYIENDKLNIQLCPALQEIDFNIGNNIKFMQEISINYDAAKWEKEIKDGWQYGYIDFHYNFCPVKYLEREYIYGVTDFLIRVKIRRSSKYGLF